MASLILSVPEAGIEKKIKVTVGGSTKEVEIETKVVIPQSVYIAYIGEKIEIIPEIYPDSKQKGKWMIEGEKGIVSMKQNTFSAEKPGEVTMRYSLEENDKIFADCKVIVKMKTELGDINADGSINLVDLMMCLNHVSKKKMLEGDAFIAADIDGKNGVNLLDLMRILNYVSKKNTIL